MAKTAYPWNTKRGWWMKTTTNYTGCIISSNHKGSPCFPKVDQELIWLVLNSKIYCVITVWAMLVPVLLLVLHKWTQQLCSRTSIQLSASKLFHQMHLKGTENLHQILQSVFDSQTRDLISWWGECCDVSARKACSFASTSSLFKYRSSCISGFRRVWISASLFLKV